MERRVCRIQRDSGTMRLFNFFSKESFKTKKLPKKLYAKLTGDILSFHEADEHYSLQLQDGDVIGVYHLHRSEDVHTVLSPSHHDS